MRYGLVLLLCLGTGTTFGQTKPPTFFAVVASQFDKWDANHDGVLSKAETDDLVVNPQVKGTAAAALMSLHSMQNNKKIVLPAVTKQYLQNQIALDGKPNQPDFQRRYVNALSKIQKSPRDLFIGAVSLDTMHQGRMGDCYLIAPMGAMVARNPNAINKMFVKQLPTGYTVQFADGHTVNVPPLTDTEIALTGTTEGHGLWLAAMEKAISLVKKVGHGDMNDTDSVAGAIGQGGSVLRFIPLLTGHQGRSMGFHEKDSPPKATESKVKVKLADLRQVLTQAMTQRRIVCCSTTNETGVPGLPSHHAYAMLSFDAGKDIVELWNPHGNKFIPKGPAGLANGYPTTDGKFTMPLKDFVKAFRSISYEGSAPATYTTPKKKA